MLTLRFPWLWWALGWLLVAGVSVGSLIPGDWLPYVSARDKLVHAGTYCLMMIWFSGLYGRRRHWLIAMLLGALGIVLELAQSFSPYRSFDLADAAANSGGILVGLALGMFIFEGWCRRVENLILS